MFKELWFLENPVETKIGAIRFVKVREYEKLLILSSILQTDKKEIINFMKINYKSFENIDELINELNIYPFLQIIKEIKQLGLYDGYTKLFDFCFENKGSFDLINSDEELEFYVNLIKEMNCIEFEKPSINPELEYFNKLERIARERKGEVITFKSMTLNVGLYKNNVLDISIYNLHEYFNTIATNKNYNTTVLFQTVSTKELKLTPWYADLSIKKTDINEIDKSFIDKHLLMVRDNPEKNGIIDKLQL